ncbi:RNA polymerase sigma factor, sigma-70 family [Fodinibius roseus]|uniref:RNA polymerase sigma factor, sigma-70 family n=1 Tax=Fodinibius roseus TaxID=1194090 RepID=A0A1M5DR59_9BACT|nr:sigma-70 family RNA polymerase sigma factor [Fodinibius roseus]SHF69364.1 RNA polymerase sigma factor, sigma-70 family [Fodinibius roseus]
MLNQSNLSDKWKLRNKEELWTSFTEDNREAFSVLFLRCYERLFRYGMHFASNEDTVKDGIQKLFFRLWKKRSKLTCPQSVDGYLYVSLRRILLRQKERQQSRQERNIAFMEEELDHIFSMEELIIFKEERKKRQELFLKALQQLTPRQKEALLLRVDSGMSNGEISKIMEISDKRVRNLIYEATKRLKKEISEQTGKIKEE